MYEIDLSEKLDKLNSELKNYWRWVTEGKKEYGYLDGEQFYYDPYHNLIDYSPDEDIYYFRIRIFDSVDGDIWWNGKFKINNGGVIEIIEENKVYGSNLF